MIMKENGKTGYSIRSYRVRLYDRHLTWLKCTKTLYNHVSLHFYKVICQRSELLEQSDFQLLRTLEMLCIGTKEMKAKKELPEAPLTDFPKIPLYFRRSAINAAVTMARRNSNNSCSLTGLLESSMPEFPMTLYQGMYREFNDQTIELKLYDGSRWRWVRYPFTGRELPTECHRMSPLLVIEKKQAYLDVPLKFTVSDVRTVKERMKEEEYICAVAFPDYDVTAVAVVLDKEGKEQACSFFRGGKQREYQRQRLLEQLKRSQNSRKKNGENANKALFKKLQKLNSHYAHTISRQILAFCQAQELKVIVVPNYEETIDFTKKQYLKTDSYRWLGRTMIKNLKYKAFQEGIIVTSVKPYQTTKLCSECGEKIRRYNEGHSASETYYGGKLFLCPNGHKGNVAQNSARNIGRLFLGYYQEQTEGRIKTAQEERV